MFLKKNNFIYFNNLIGNRVSIRELNLEDADDVFELLSNPNVTKYLSIDEFKNIDQATSLINRAINQYQNKDIFYLGIINNEDNKLVGYIGLSRFDLTIDTCQIVYALNEKYWGRGIMVDAVKLFINYLMNDLGKKKVIATHIDVNQNSGKVMIKAGMFRDKLHDQDMVIKGKTEKLIGYSIIKE